MQRAPSTAALTTLLALSLSAVAACSGAGAGDASPIPSTGVPVAAVDARGVDPPRADLSLAPSPTTPPRMSHPKVAPAPTVAPFPAPPPDPFAPPITPPPTPPKPTSTGVPL